jgi:hypothetical protein
VGSQFVEVTTPFVQARSLSTNFHRLTHAKLRLALPLFVCPALCPPTLPMGPILTLLFTPE